MANLFVEFIALLGQVIFYGFEALWLLVFPRLKKLDGELVLITGGASGIGRLCALGLAKEGCNIVIWDINKEGLDKVRDEVKALGVNCWTYICDISKRENVYEVANRVKKDAGNITIILNNAGIVSAKKFIDTPDNLIEKTFQVNTMAHFWIVKAFLPSMLEKNHGHIVSIASNAGLIGVPGLADYCASKFAVVGFDESLRMEFTKMGKDGVKTTCVCPYFINTGMFDGAKTKFPNFLPILDPDYVARKIIFAIKSNQSVLVLPRFAYSTMLVRSLFPVKSFDEISRFFGTSDAMDSFKGRVKTD